MQRFTGAKGLSPALPQLFRAQCQLASEFIVQKKCFMPNKLAPEVEANSGPAGPFLSPFVQEACAALVTGNPESAWNCGDVHPKRSKLSNHFLTVATDKFKTLQCTFVRSFSGLR